jgi:hypothetical protein
MTWCLGGSVKDDGSLVSPDGFWRARVPPGDPAKIRTGMIARLKIFNPYYTEIDDALVRLGAPEHPWTNAIL